MSLVTHTNVTWLIHRCDISHFYVYDSFHWKCCTPKIHQIEKLKFLSTNSNSTKISIWIRTARNWGIWGFQFDLFRGRSFLVESVLFMSVTRSFCHRVVFIYIYKNVSCHIYERDVTHLYVWVRDVRLCDMSHSYLWEDAFCVRHAWMGTHTGVLQCVAVCCSVLQCVAVCCSVLQCVAVRCSALQCVAVLDYLCVVVCD